MLRLEIDRLQAHIYTSHIEVQRVLMGLANEMAGRCGALTRVVKAAQEATSDGGARE